MGNIGSLVSIVSSETRSEATPVVLPSSPSSPSSPVHPRLLLLPLRAIRTSSLNPRGFLDDLATGLEGLTTSLSSPGSSGSSGTAQAGSDPDAGQGARQTGGVSQADEVSPLGQTAQMVQFPAVMQIAQDLAQEAGQGPLEGPADASYELIFGHRRLLAARQAGWSELWCIVYPPLSPLQVHDMRLRENMHREPLEPLAEAAALQVLYLLENAEALGFHEQVRHIMGPSIPSAEQPAEQPADAALLYASLQQSGTSSTGGSLRSKIAPLRDLLEQNGWSDKRPALNWQTVLDKHGIDMEPGARKRRLKMLKLDECLLPAIQAAGLSLRAVEAIGTLPSDAQRTLVDALCKEPHLAPKVRHIARVVNLKKYTLDEALEIARGPLSLRQREQKSITDSQPGPGRAVGRAEATRNARNAQAAHAAHAAQAAGAGDPTDNLFEGQQTSRTYDDYTGEQSMAIQSTERVEHVEHVERTKRENNENEGSGVSEDIQARVAELLGLANRTSQLLGEIGMETGVMPATLPDPWGGYVNTALTLLHNTISTHISAEGSTGSYGHSIYDANL